MRPDQVTSPSISGFSAAVAFAMSLLFAAAFAHAIDPAPASPAPADETNSVPAGSEGIKKGKPLPDIDWDEFMRQSNIAPFVIPATATTEDEIHAKYVAWVKKRLLDPELERLVGDPDEAALRPLVESATGFYTSGQPVLDDAAISRLIQQVQGSVRRPGIDFIFANVLEDVGRTDPAIQGYQWSAEAPSDSGLPSICRLFSAAKLLLRADHFHQGDRGALEKKFFERFAENLADAPVDEEDLRRTLVTHLGGVIDQARSNRERQCVDLYRKSGLPEWARLAMIGQTEMQWAYRLGGKEVFKAGKKDRAAAATQAKNARQALTRAWELKPDSPYAAQQMIIAVGRGNQPDPAELRQWLDRALAAECDFELAFRNYFWACRETENYELADTLAIGRACLETGRFDTELPTMFNLAVCEAAGSLADWHSYFANPAIAQALLDTRRKRLAKAAGGPDESGHLEQLAFEAWLTGDDALAAQTIARLAKTGSLPRLDGAFRFNAYMLSVDPEIAMRDAALRGSDHGADYKKALGEISAGQSDAAIEDFQKALPGADAYARPLLGADLKLAKFAKQFAAGDWTPLPAGDRLCWSVLDGNWDWRPGVKHIRLTASESFGRSFFRGALGADFELRGRLNFSRPSRCPGGVTFYCGHPPVGAGADASDSTAVQVFCTGEREILVQFIPEEEMGDAQGTKTVRWTKEEPFLYRLHAGKVSFSIGDKELLHECKLPDDEPTGEGAVGVGVLGYGEGSFGEVWSLEARRLDPNQ